MRPSAKHASSEAVRTGEPGAVPLTALVLAGGRARRLGGSKALLDVGGSSMLLRAMALAHAVSDDVLLAPGSRGYRMPDARLVADDPLAGGPLGGLLGGLALARHEWTLLLPCDQPFADEALVATLARVAACTEADAVLVRDDFGLQPFHGLYRRRALAAGRSVALRGRLALAALLDALVVEALPAPAARPGPLFDVDTPDDLLRARSHVAQQPGTEGR